MCGALCAHNGRSVFISLFSKASIVMTIVVTRNLTIQVQGTQGAPSLWKGLLLVAPLTVMSGASAMLPQGVPDEPRRHDLRSSNHQNKPKLCIYQLQPTVRRQLLIASR